MLLLVGMDVPCFALKKYIADKLDIVDDCEKLINPNPSEVLPKPIMKGPSVTRSLLDLPIFDISDSA